MNGFKENNLDRLQRYDSSSLLATELNLPPISEAQAATILFLAVEPEKIAAGNEDTLRIIEKFGLALKEKSLKNIQKALTVRLFGILSSAFVPSNTESRQAVLDSNFSEISDAISEREENVLQYMEIFQLLSIKPIPTLLEENFDKIVKDKKIPVRRARHSGDFKMFFVYTENNVLKEVCELLTPSDVARMYDSTHSDKHPQTWPEEIRQLTITEESLSSIAGLKEVAFYYLIFQMIRSKQINRLYTHELTFAIETLQCTCESEGQNETSRFVESIAKLKRYPVSSNPPGICLIFNMTDNRNGADKDIKSVKRLFEEVYKYDVILKIDPSKQEINTVVNRLKEPRNKFYDSLVVWFMGHGSQNFLYVKNGEIDRRKEFIEPFTEIKWLNKKPKLFFIQACTAEDSDISAKTKKRKGSTAMEADKDASAFGNATTQHWDKTYGPFMEFDSVNHYADTLIAYAANWSAYAARNGKGSLWVQTLIEVLEKLGYADNLENVLRAVHYNVNTVALTTDERDWKQTPYYESSLQKEFIFPRNDKMTEEENG